VGPPLIARRVIQGALSPRFVSEMNSYDGTSTVWRLLPQAEVFARHIQAGRVAGAYKRPFSGST